jgi:ceramide glucosyltransferase
VAPGYLSELVRHRAATGAGLVSSPIRARPGRTLGAALESLQLNTYVMGGVGAIAVWCGSVCCVGKSMAFRRGDLERVGGFGMLARHLAEDQVCGEAFARAGLGATVSSAPVENVLGPLSVRDFCARHVRWARLRRWMAPAGYAAEVLANPVAASFAALVALPFSAAAPAVVGALLVRVACDAAMEARVGVRRPLAVRTGLLLLKESLALALWPVPFLGRVVTWRGSRYRLGARTVAELLPARGAARYEPAVVADLVLDWDADGDPVAATA